MVALVLCAPKAVWYGSFCLRDAISSLPGTTEHYEIGAITPMVCNSYVELCKAHRQTGKSNKPLSQRALCGRFQAIEALHELSQCTDQPIPQHPWPDTSAMSMVGLNGSGAHNKQGGKTPLIPDDIFCKLFQKAHECLERGHELLDLRDEFSSLEMDRNNRWFTTIIKRKISSLRTTDGAVGCKSSIVH